VGMIFLDMDGVLVDLELGMEQVLGVKCSGDRSVMFKEQLPRFVELDGFATAPVMPGARVLVDDVGILTSIGQFADGWEVIEQKKAWIAEFFPELANVPFCATTSGTDKAKLAWPGSMLIDDHQPNVDAFRAAGGTAIKYPEEFCDFPRF
jgi:hypothetical protein